MMGLDLSDVFASYGDPAGAFGYIVELVKKEHQRTLAGAGTAQNSQSGTRGNIYVDVLQHVVALFIGKGYILKFDVPGHIPFDSTGGILLFFGVHDICQTVQRYSGLGHL